MRKTLIMLAVMLATALTFSSCGSNSPKGVVKQYFKCIKSGDVKGYLELSDMDEELRNALIEKLEKSDELESMSEQIKERVKDLNDIEVVSEEIDDDSDNAEVKIKMELDGKDDEGTIKLHKNDNGEWKVIQSRMF